MHKALEQFAPHLIEGYEQQDAQEFLAYMRSTKILCDGKPSHYPTCGHIGYPKKIRKSFHLKRVFRKSRMRERRRHPWTHQRPLALDRGSPACPPRPPKSSIKPKKVF